MNSNIFNYTNNNGLVQCSNAKEACNYHEVLYIEEASKLNAHSVLFRRYFIDDSKNAFKSEPAVCIFIKDDQFFNSQEHISLHAALWSAGRTEVYIIKGKTRIDVINARNPAHVNKDGTLSLEELLLATSTAIKGINETLFSAHLFANGTFWEQPIFQKIVDEKNSPYIYLLDYLMIARKQFLAATSLKIPPETIDKLLITSILIKFLEEITDDAGKHTLRSIYKKYKIVSFAEAVEAGNGLDILNELSNEFNGRIFDNFSEKEKNQISKSDLTLLAKFLRANIDLKTNQLFLWEQYSFKHLPAEVISAIYENFIQAEAVRNNGQKEKGVVYTPIHLVNLMVDEVMPLSNAKVFENNLFRVLDPACGSGVFLVAAFKRLLQWWAINNSTRSNIQFPDCKTAQKILEDNIFGVDVKKTAILISIFSLTTALLDKLSPQEIWNKLKFRDLSQQNLKSESFFSWAVDQKSSDIKFDLIIGNPPFNVETGKNRQEVLNANIIGKLELRENKIPDNNFALHFFEVSATLAQKICLVIPANVLLYSPKSREYRQKLFVDYTVSKIFDFTHLRRDLFHRTADTPIVAVICIPVPSTQKPIEHIVVKRTVSSEKRIRFEIDYYDRHTIPFNWATDPSKHFVWKTNLLGGGRLFQLINRLSQLDTLFDFIESRKADNSEWIYEVGYEAGNAKNRKIVNYLHNQDKITEIDGDGKIISDDIEASKYFYRAKCAPLFTTPLLVIHKKVGDQFLPVGIKERHRNGYLVFNSSYVGIHAPRANYQQLRLIYDRLKNYSELYLLWILNNSASSLVSQETSINKSDLDTLPFPSFENDDFLSLNEYESVVKDDVLKYYVHLGKAIGENGDGAPLHLKTEQPQLKRFGTLFCKVLNEYYSGNGKSWQRGNVYSNEQFVIYQFGFGSNGNLTFKYNSIAGDSINTIIEDSLSNSGAKFSRILRLYKHTDGYDCVYFIKPNSQRYWLNSIALKDADETFFDLRNAGF